jgi:hypothetical protein
MSIVIGMAIYNLTIQSLVELDENSNPATKIIRIEADNAAAANEQIPPAWVLLSSELASEDSTKESASSDDDVEILTFDDVEENETHLEGPQVEGGVSL